MTLYMEMENLIVSANNPTDLYGMKEILTQYETVLPKKGDVLAGEVISISKKGVLIDLDLLGTGLIYPSEFYDNPALQKSLEEGEVISTTILNINKGGLIVEVNGIQGFLPLSQLSPEHYPKVEGGDTSKIVQALQKFRGQNFDVKILDFSEAEGKLIVSERAIMADKLREEIAKYKVGDLIEGAVTDITDFGAFVKITESLEGLVHISEIDWKIIDNPRDYLTIGQTISAKIINIENGRISLSLKALKADPWENIEEKFKVGQTVEGQLVKVTNYGLLVKVSEDIMGLIPASEINNRQGSQGGNMQPGEKISVAIVSIDPKEHKMLLTIQSQD